MQEQKEMMRWHQGVRTPLPPPGTRVVVVRGGLAAFATVEQHDRVMLDSFGEECRAGADPRYTVLRGDDRSWWWSYALSLPGC